MSSPDRKSEELVVQMPALKTNIMEVEVVPPPPKPQSKWMAIYRSSLFQICVVSALAFCGPAMADAISGLGGGGQATPYTVNAATCASYCAVAVISLLGGPLASRMGIKGMLIAGAATFAINGSAYYVNSKYGVQWYLIFGRFLYGAGFGFWYVAEAAIILSYPEEGRRGKYLAIWVGSRNLGQLVGGSISLARNAKTAAAGAIATSTYLIFVAIEAIGFPISFLISPPHKVRRSDGVPIVLAAKKPWKNEFLDLYRAIISPRMLLLMPIGFYSYFYGGVLSTYLTNYFSVRARALSSFIVPTGIIVFTGIYGKFFLDNKHWTQRRRAQIGFAIFMIPSLASFGWLCANQAKFLNTNPKYDWNSAGWANAYIPFYIMQICGYLCQTYIYWLISCFTTDVGGNARNGGIFRCVEAVGQAVSYGINSNAKTRFIPLGINFGLAVLCIPSTYVIIQQVPHYRADDVNRPITHGQEEGTGSVAEEIDDELKKDVELRK
ncbi:membrane protein [Cryptococcus neoformans A2-102-5]|uniref:Membrane protein n=1 Tax=Cryptococcus neoformans Tu259-1 TaxID=1230072 RepID=A0A854QED4_CRYNE|nr:membrane protein [Cryptococcus neoformans var. grubii Tu259-1]OXG80632.1 membrane protein [Cryptococcus neoformans var. grubii D17-1]OXG93392.1 membrane protein [Cryptococcus neoformans var. grubii A2-102-5]